jgi:glycosyltransferase involved in cell wall biosynthesis
VKVLVVTEYYPRAGDPVRGIWAHRQALAAREAGAELRVLVLHRPLPPLAAVRARDLGRARRELLQPPRGELDGLAVEYLRYISPPRPWSYGAWGAWAAPWLSRRLNRLQETFPFELIHAHYAVPAGDAVRRAAPGVPLVVSVHGHDVFGGDSATPGPGVRRALGHARLVLANSAGTAQRSRLAGAHETRVVHLGTDVPAGPVSPPGRPTLVTVAHLAERKRHLDVLEAIGRLADRQPELRYVIVGDGPQRPAIEAAIRRLSLGDRVELRGALAPPAAIAVAQASTLFVMPSVDEAFGVAYVEAMAAGIPAIGCHGEAGPEEIAAAGGGITLVPPRDPASLAEAIEGLLTRLREPETAAAERALARQTVERSFTWPACGRATVAAYEEALSR